MSNKKTTPPLRGTPPKEGNHSPSPKGWQAKPDGVVPRLRFPEFQDDWVVAKLCELGKLSGGGTPDKSVAEYWQGDIPWISSSDIYEDDIYTISVTRFINEKSISESATKIVPKGSVLFVSRVGTGKLAINDIDVCTSQDFMNFIPKKVSNYFLGYFFIANKSSLVSLGQGTSIKGFSKGDLEKLEVSFPDDLEQQKIADCLSSIDELITAQTQKLATLKTHKKGLMQQLFPAEGETLPKLRFPEFQDAPEWEENLLGSRVMKVGSGITPRGGDKNYKNNGRPFVRSQNVGWGELLLDDVAYIDEQTHATFPATEIENGDVLLNITGASIGRCAVADFRIKRGNVNQHVCIIRLKAEELTPEFLNQYLLSQYGQKQIDSFQAGGNRQGLNFAQVRSFVIPHPSQEEQIKVAQFLSSIDELITAQTQKLATLKTHKKALMQQLFPAMEEVSS